VSKARRALKAETVQLVAAATEHIVHEKIDGKKDANLIEHALRAKEQA
jgi:F0F1-type ATP synthase membrane subunit b/b'